MEQLSFKLDAFEGPLDLLLVLIRKNKIDIYDIPIAVVLEQYMGTIEDMKAMDLEVSSEFLVLAATLLQIKSKMLLPKYDEEESDEDPREELVRRLLEYQRYKEATKFLTEREHSGSLSYFKNPDFIEQPGSEFNFAKLTVENLRFFYKRAFSKLERRTPPPKTSFLGIVGHEKVPVRDKIRSIFASLLTKSKILFSDLFKGVKSRPEAVASFLAVLELIRLNKVRPEYKRNGEITLYPLDDNLDFNMEIEDN